MTNVTLFDRVLDALKMTEGVLSSVADDNTAPYKDAIVGIRNHARALIAEADGIQGTLFPDGSRPGDDDDDDGPAILVPDDADGPEPPHTADAEKAAAVLQFGGGGGGVIEEVVSAACNQCGGTIKVQSGRHFLFRFGDDGLFCSGTHHAEHVRERDTAPVLRTYAVTWQRYVSEYAHDDVMAASHDDAMRIAKDRAAYEPGNPLDFETDFDSAGDVEWILVEDEASCLEWNKDDDTRSL